MATRNPSFGAGNPLADYESAVRANNSGSGGADRFGVYMPADPQARSQYLNELQMRANAAAVPGAAGAPAVDPAKSRQQILNYTAGRGDAVMNDAMTNAALSRLQGVAQGNDAPFTQAVQNQMLASQAGANAASESSQAGMLARQAAANGGSMADPSYQEKLRQLAAQRQSSNLSAQGGIQTNAQLQNFGARQTANNNLISSRLGQMGMGNAQYNQAANFLQNDSTMGAHQSAVQSPYMYSFNPYAQSSMSYTPPGVRPYPGAQTGTGSVTPTATQATTTNAYSPSQQTPYSHISGSAPTGGGYIYNGQLSDPTVNVQPAQNYAGVNTIGDVNDLLAQQFRYF